MPYICTAKTACTNSSYRPKDPLDLRQVAALLDQSLDLMQIQIRLRELGRLPMPKLRVQGQVLVPPELPILALGELDDLGRALARVAHGRDASCASNTANTISAPIIAHRRDRAAIQIGHSRPDG
jgi:hypothetical protein